MTELNYQDLVTGYYDNLNNNLRNFKGGPGFLETWVHDEDHNRSLLEILDLAHSHGIDALNIQLPPAVADSLNLDWLRRNASEFGSLELKGKSLTFSKAKGNFTVDEFAGVSENYREKIKAAAKAIRHEGQLKGLAASHGQGQLSVVLNDNMVKDAKHLGFHGAERGVMDAFCAILIGRPMQEGSEHGVIRLEAALRDPARPIKVKGLMTPEIADPIFALANQLVRQIWKDYVNAQGSAPGRNFWRDPVPQSWLALAPEEKLKQAQIQLTAACREFGLQVDVLVTEIKNDTRLVLSYKQNPEKPDFGRHMIKLERWLRSKMGFEIELQLESIEDRNRREERTKRT
jgi:hypothetical protein